MLFFANYEYYPRFGFKFITFKNRFAAKNANVGTSSVNNVCALALSLMQLVGTDTGRACRRP
jgi:hypothetical protein